MSFHAFRKHARVSLESSGENNLKSNLIAAGVRCVYEVKGFCFWDCPQSIKSTTRPPRKRRRIPPLLVYTLSERGLARRAEEL